MEGEACVFIHLHTHTYNPTIQRAYVHIHPNPLFVPDTRWSSALRDFLGKCLQKDPAQRWDAARLLAHPWLAGARREYEGKMMGKRGRRGGRGKGGWGLRGVYGRWVFRRLVD